MISPSSNTLLGTFAVIAPSGETSQYSSLLASVLPHILERKFT